MSWQLHVVRRAGGALLVVLHREVVRMNMLGGVVVVRAVRREGMLGWLVSYVVVLREGGGRTGRVEYFGLRWSARKLADGAGRRLGWLLLRRILGVSAGCMSGATMVGYG